MRRTTIIIVLAASLTAFVVPSTAAASPWQLNRTAGRETVIGAGMYHPGVYDSVTPVVVSVPGSRRGAVASKAKKITPEDVGVETLHESFDSGDLDGDGDADLVLGADESTAVDIPSTSPDIPSGTLVVVPGGAGGPLIESAYTVENPQSSGRMGRSVYVSDLDRDGYADVITTQITYGYSTPDTAITIFWGGASGLRHDRSTTFDTPAAMEPDGTDVLRLGAGNLVGDSRREIAIVEPGDRDVDMYSAGALLLCRVSARTVSCGDARAVEAFVADLAVGDVVGDRRADLVLGSRGGNFADVYRGTAKGLARRVRVSQATPGVPGGTEKPDAFGQSLAIADLDRDGKGDLAVGAPGEDASRGRVTLLYGHRDGLGRSTKDRAIDQSTSGVPGTSERYDSFGSEVSLLDVDGNGAADLIVGARGENNGGAVTIIRSTDEGRLAPSRSRVIYPATVGLEPVEGLNFGEPIGK